MTHREPLSEDEQYRRCAFVDLLMANMDTGLFTNSEFRKFVRTSCEQFTPLAERKLLPDGVKGVDYDKE
jgi:hypothetical protein